MEIQDRSTHATPQVSVYIIEGTEVLPSAADYKTAISISKEIQNDAQNGIVHWHEANSNAFLH